LEPLIFALTGGIGSGKSTVAQVFREAGVPVVDADQVARDVVLPGTPALGEIEAEFGASVLDASGALDRAALAGKVFEDPPALARLNSIVHPRVRDEVRRRFQKLVAEGASLLAYEIPLLFETKQEENYRPVVVVSCSPETQIRRASARDGASTKQIRDRIQAQLPLSEKAARADYVIENEGDIEALSRKALDVLQAIRGVKV